MGCWRSTDWKRTLSEISQVYNKWNKRLSVSEFYEMDKPALYYEGVNANYLSAKKRRELVETVKLDMWSEKALECIFQRELSKTTPFLYGAGDRAKWVMRRWRKTFSLFKNIRIIDSNIGKQGKNLSEIFSVEEHDRYVETGHIVENPECLREIGKNDVVIICANHYYEGAGIEIGNYLQEEFGLRDGNNMFFIDKLDNSLKIEISASQFTEVLDDIL